ncbi:hypothetical protein C0J52_04521 [Blattella germanica]|nr:hypothetical protein C0J52_04521 [Blattella germanica]
MQIARWKRTVFERRRRTSEKMKTELLILTALVLFATYLQVQGGFIPYPKDKNTGCLFFVCFSTCTRWWTVQGKCITTNQTRSFLPTFCKHDEDCPAEAPCWLGRCDV